VESPSRAVRDARERLGVERLALAIHDASFPGGPKDDLGRGAPASPAALELVGFAQRAGFDALQLGPQGLTADDDPSPYMGCLFSRNPLSISLARLADPNEEWGELLPASRLAALVAARPEGGERRVPYAFVLCAQQSALGAAFERFERRRAEGDPRALGLAERLQHFERSAGPWLASDALYDVLAREYGGRDWNDWSGPHAETDHALGNASNRDAASAARRAEITARSAPALRFYRFVQLLAHEQHARLRAESRTLGVELIGDLQIGVSPRDTWRWAGIFLEGYRLGAPPSRTNPEGQPWNYPVLAPDAYRYPPGDDGEGDGPALQFVTERIVKMLAEYDAIRIDHPQGFVSPWVYRAGVTEALAAVQGGARLFASPDLPDHAELARFAIARRADLNRDPAVARYADDWVVRLDAAQLDRYALLFDRVVEIARRNGAPRRVLLCEVLSTLPYPLACVLERHGLGRFRVTQKADPNDPRDVYRAENARPDDWIMFGNHDTPPLWRLLEEWRADGRVDRRAANAAARLEPSDAAREAFRSRLVAEPGLMAHAEIAQLFASPARNVSIFFTDLFGMTDVYNRPGTLDPQNWCLRLGHAWRSEYAARVEDDRALNLPLALWLALRARPGVPSDLLGSLRDEAERPRRGLRALPV
jgi:4-alpha-glucanotransferase